MKLIVNKEAILEGLQKAGSIIPARAGAAYLRAIWLRAANNTLSIMTTDANLEFTGAYPADVVEDGLMGVSGRTFVDLVKQFPSGPMELRVNEEKTNLSVTQGKRCRYNLPVYSSEWFQEFSSFPNEDPVAWTGDFLLDLIDRVSFCIDDEESRDAMACLCFKPLGDGKIEVCGMDGHKFAMVQFDNDDLCAKLPATGLLINKKFLPDIKKWLGPDEIELNLSDKRLFLKGRDGTEILSVVHETGYTYPDYNVFLSKLHGEGVTDLTLPRNEAIDVLKRMVVFAQEGTQPCVLMDLSANELTFSANGSDGSAKESIEAEYNGEMEKIAFPTRDLLEIFGHFVSETITMRFTGSEGPCGITADGDPRYTVIVMPMRIADKSYYDDEKQDS